MLIPTSMLEMNFKGPAFMFFLGLSLQPAQAGMIDKEGMAPWEICGMCHGLDGNSHMSKFPKLAGQKADYIKAQFIAFRSGERTNDGGQMQAITEEVQPEEIDSIAHYFAQLTAPAPTDEGIDDALYQQGELLFRMGRAGLPACQECHNPARSDTPWLDAQHEDYLKKQLDDFRVGNRTNDTPSVMRNIAIELKPDEQSAVVHYLSRSVLRAGSQEPQ